MRFQTSYTHLIFQTIVSYPITHTAESGTQTFVNLAVFDARSELEGCTLSGPMASHLEDGAELYDMLKRKGLLDDDALVGVIAVSVSFGTLDICQGANSNLSLKSIDQNIKWVVAVVEPLDSFVTENQGELVSHRGRC